MAAAPSRARWSTWPKRRDNRNALRLRITAAIYGREFRDLSDEGRHSPGLSRDHGRDDRRVELSDAVDLRQGGRHAAPRNRPEIAPGLDRRPPAAPRPPPAPPPPPPPPPHLPPPNT